MGNYFCHSVLSYNPGMSFSFFFFHARDKWTQAEQEELQGTKNLHLFTCEVILF